MIETMKSLGDAIESHIPAAKALKKLAPVEELVSRFKKRTRQCDKEKRRKLRCFVHSLRRLKKQSSVKAPYALRRPLIAWSADAN